MSDPAPELGDSSLQPVADLAPPEDFKPLCLDCRYDLFGLPDGKCPECGVKFTHAQLLRVFQAQRLAREERMKTLWVKLPLIPVYSSPLIGVLISEELVTSAQSDSPLRWMLCLAIALVFHAVGCGVWFRVHREVWIAQSENVLWFPLPVLVLAPTILAMPYGRVLCVGMFAYASIYALLALRWSPLKAATILTAVGAVPLIGVGVLLWLESTHKIMVGHHWSFFDFPTPTGWRAMTARQSQAAAPGFIVGGLIFCAAIALYARRAKVRLEHRAGSRG